MISQYFKFCGLKFRITVMLFSFMIAFPVGALAEEVSWTGCGITKKAFMGEIAKAYQKDTGIKITLIGGGATRGIRTASAGTSDLGGTCRHWLLDPAGNKHPAETDAELVQVAWDAIVAITHPNNPVKNISLADLKKIYNGTITNWKELGGPDKRIVLVTRDGKESGVGHMFRTLVFNDPAYEFKARSLKVASSGPLEQKIEGTITALGVTGISSAKKREVNILALDGVEASKENIAASKYPLWRPLYIAINKNAPSRARKVIDYLMSAKGQEIISNQGTVNLEEGKELKALWDRKKKQMGL